MKNYLNQPSIQEGLDKKNNASHRRSNTSTPFSSIVNTEENASAKQTGCFVNKGMQVGEQSIQFAPTDSNYFHENNKLKFIQMKAAALLQGTSTTQNLNFPSLMGSCSLKQDSNITATIANSSHVSKRRLENGKNMLIQSSHQAVTSMNNSKGFEMKQTQKSDSNDENYVAHNFQCMNTDGQDQLSITNRSVFSPFSPQFNSKRSKIPVLSNQSNDRPIRQLLSPKINQKTIAVQIKNNPSKEFGQSLPEVNWKSLAAREVASKRQKVGITGFSVQIEKTKQKKPIQYYVRPDGSVGRADRKGAAIPLSSIMVHNYDVSGVSVDDMLDSIGTPTDKMKKELQDQRRSKMKTKKQLQKKKIQPQAQQRLLPLWICSKLPSTQNQSQLSPKPQTNPRPEPKIVENEGQTALSSLNEANDVSKEFSLPMTPESLFDPKDSLYLPKSIPWTPPSRFVQITELPQKYDQINLKQQKEKPVVPQLKFPLHMKVEEGVLSHQKVFGGINDSSFSQTRETELMDIPRETREKSLGEQSTNILSKQPEISQKEQRELIQILDELTQKQQLQPILLKLWKLIAKIQYKMHFAVEKQTERSAQTIKTIFNKFEQTEKQKQPSLDSQISSLPVDILLYEQCMKQIVQAFGALVDNTSLIAKRPEYQKDHIFFDRFCFDLLSLFGKHLKSFSVQDIEYVLRMAFFNLSHQFQPNDPQILQTHCMPQSPFGPEALSKLNHELNLPLSPGQDGGSNDRSTGIEFGAGEVGREIAKSKGTHMTELDSKSPLSNERIQQVTHSSETFIHGSDGSNTRHNTAQKDRVIKIVGDNRPYSSKEDGSESNENKKEPKNQKANEQDLNQLTPAGGSQIVLGQKLNQDLCSPLESAYNDHHKSGQDVVQELTDQKTHESREKFTASGSALEETLRSDSNKGLTVDQILAKGRAKKEAQVKWKREEVQRIAKFNEKALPFNPSDPQLVASKLAESARKLEDKYMILATFHQARRRYRGRYKKEVVEQPNENGETSQSARRETLVTQTSLQTDFLEHFKQYDEAKLRNHSQMDPNQLTDGAPTGTELRLFASNKINRKTILLEKLRSLDMEARGGNGEVEQMETMREQLVKKLGQQNIQNILQKHQVQKPDKLMPIDFIESPKDSTGKESDGQRGNFYVLVSKDNKVVAPSTVHEDGREVDEPRLSPNYSKSLEDGSPQRVKKIEVLNDDLMLAKVKTLQNSAGNTELQSSQTHITRLNERVNGPFQSSQMAQQHHRAEVVTITGAGQPHGSASLSRTPPDAGERGSKERVAETPVHHRSSMNASGPLENLNRPKQALSPEAATRNARGTNNHNRVYSLDQEPPQRGTEVLSADSHQREEQSIVSLASKTGSKGKKGSNQSKETKSKNALASNKDLQHLKLRPSSRAFGSSQEPKSEPQSTQLQGKYQAARGGENEQQNQNAGGGHGSGKEPGNEAEIGKKNQTQQQSPRDLEVVLLAFQEENNKYQQPKQDQHGHPNARVKPKPSLQQKGKQLRGSSVAAHKADRAETIASSLLIEKGTLREQLTKKPIDKQPGKEPTAPISKEQKERPGRLLLTSHCTLANAKGENRTLSMEVRLRQPVAGDQKKNSVGKKQLSKAVSGPEGETPDEENPKETPDEEALNIILQTSTLNCNPQRTKDNTGQSTKRDQRWPFDMYNKSFLGTGMQRLRPKGINSFARPQKKMVPSPEQRLMGLTLQSRQLQPLATLISVNASTQNGALAQILPEAGGSALGASAGSGGQVTSGRLSPANPLYGYQTFSYNHYASRHVAGAPRIKIPTYPLPERYSPARASTGAASKEKEPQTAELAARGAQAGEPERLSRAHQTANGTSRKLKISEKSAEQPKKEEASPESKPIQGIRASKQIYLRTSSEGPQVALNTPPLKRSISRNRGSGSRLGTLQDSGNLAHRKENTLERPKERPRPRRVEVAMVLGDPSRTIAARGAPDRAQTRGTICFAGPSPCQVIQEEDSHDPDDRRRANQDLRVHGEGSARQFSPSEDQFVCQSFAIQPVHKYELPEVSGAGGEQYMRKKYEAHHAGYFEGNEDAMRAAGAYAQKGKQGSRYGKQMYGKVEVARKSGDKRKSPLQTRISHFHASGEGSYQEKLLVKGERAQGQSLRISERNVDIGISKAPNQESVTITIPNSSACSPKKNLNKLDYASYLRLLQKLTDSNQIEEVRNIERVHGGKYPAACTLTSSSRQASSEQSRSHVQHCLACFRLEILQSSFYSGKGDTHTRSKNSGARSSRCAAELAQVTMTDFNLGAEKRMVKH